MFERFLKMFRRPPHQSPEQVTAELKSVLALVADYADKHDVFIPEVNVEVGAVKINLSMKRVARTAPLK